MGRDRLASTPAWLDPNRLVDLIDELRNSGHNIGLGQYVRALELIDSLQARGEPLDHPDRLKTLLAPLLCGSPSEQVMFYRRYDQWAAHHRPPVEPPILEEREVDETASSLQRVTRAARRIRLAWALVIGLAGLAAVVYWVRSGPDAEPVLVEPSAVSQSQATQTTSSSGQNQATAGTAPEVVPPTAAEPEPEPQPSRSGWWKWLGGLSLLLAAGYVMRRFWWRYQAQLLLQRRETRETAPEVERIKVQGLADHLFPRLLFARIATEFRRRVDAPGDRLDLSRTVTRTVASGGWFTPVFGRRQVSPEYLVLIDCAHVADHQAQFHADLVAQLVREHVLVNRYTFNGDPRLCFPAAGGPPLSLRELIAHHGRDRLLVFGDGARFFNPRTGRLLGWVERLRHWPERLLLTPRPKPEWAGREAALAEVFQLLPATTDGLEELQRRLRSPSRSPEAEPPLSPRGLPIELIQRPAPWLDRHAPPSQDVEAMLDELAKSLGESSFLWLCACAVYPEVKWDLTLYLGHRLKTPSGETVLDANRLADLARLPWFRQAYFPDWLRRALIGRLTSGQEAQIRRALAGLLLSSLRSSSDDGFILELTPPEERTATQLIASWLALIRGRPDEEGPTQERIFVDFMQGRRPDRLAVALPAAFRRMWANRRSLRLASKGHREPFPFVRLLRALAIHALAAAAGMISYNTIFELGRTLFESTAVYRGLGNDLALTALHSVACAGLGGMLGLGESLVLRLEAPRRSTTTHQTRGVRRSPAWQVMLMHALSWALGDLCFSIFRTASPSSPDLVPGVLSGVAGILIPAVGPFLASSPRPALQSTWLALRMIGTLAILAGLAGLANLRPLESLSAGTVLAVSFVAVLYTPWAGFASLRYHAAPRCIFDGPNSVRLEILYSRQRLASSVAMCFGGLGAYLLLAEKQVTWTNLAIAGGWVGLCFGASLLISLRQRSPTRCLAWTSTIAFAWALAFGSWKLFESNFDHIADFAGGLLWVGGLLAIMTLPGAVKSWWLHPNAASRIVASIVELAGLLVSLVVGTTMGVVVGMVLYLLATEADEPIRIAVGFLVGGFFAGSVFNRLTRQNLLEMRQDLLPEEAAAIGWWDEMKTRWHRLWSTPASKRHRAVDPATSPSTSAQRNRTRVNG